MNKNICPSCKNSEIETYTSDFTNGSCLRTGICYSCKNGLTIVYKFVEIEKTFEIKHTEKSVIAGVSRNIYGDMKSILTPDAIKNFTDNNACPFCESKEIDVNANYKDVFSIGTFICHSCEKAWTAIYKLSEISS
jgi:hypothetical protein